MKKTYMQPTVKVFMLQPQMMLTASDDKFNINSQKSVSNYDDLE